MVFYDLMIILLQFDLQLYEYSICYYQKLSLLVLKYPMMNNVQYAL